MFRATVLVLGILPMVGMDCSGSSSMLVCANALDGSEFGFRLVVPERFTCVPPASIQSSFVVARATYLEEPTGTAISVVVNRSESQDDGGGDGGLEGVTVEELDPLTTANDIAFGWFKITLDLGSFGTQVSYSGATALPSGLNLIISVSAEADGEYLAQTLAEILESVELIDGM